MTWSVLLEDESLPVASAPIGKLLQRVLGGVAYDHIRRLNAELGWVARGLSDERASELQTLLQREGHPALKKDEQTLVGEQKVVRVRRLDLRDDALHVEVGHLGQLIPIPWPSLSLVSIGSVRVVRQKVVKQKKRKVGLSRGMLAMGIPMPKVKTVTKLSTERVVDDGLVVQLVFAQEGLIREVRPTSFDYGYLGDRLRPTGGENLVLLLDDLRRLASQATWTRMAQAFQGSGTPPHCFEGKHQLLRFTHWVLEKTYDAGPSADG